MRPAQCRASQHQLMTPPVKEGALLDAEAFRFGISFDSLTSAHALFATASGDGPALSALAACAAEGLPSSLFSPRPRPEHYQPPPTRSRAAHRLQPAVERRCR